MPPEYADRVACEDRRVEQTRTITADAGMPARLARAYIRWQIGRGWWIALWVIAALAVVASIVLAVLTRDLTLVLLCGLWLLLITVIPLISYVTTRSAVARSYPAGSAVEVEVGGESLRTSSALGTSEVRYGAFRRVDVTRELVIMAMGARGAGAAVFPRELFSDAAVAHLQHAVRSAR